jgi:hypothetical protein
MPVRISYKGSRPPDSESRPRKPGEVEEDRLILRPSPAVTDQLEKLSDRSGKTREEVVVQALYLYDMFLQTVEAGGKVTFSGPDKPEDIEITGP